MKPEDLDMLHNIGHRLDVLAQDAAGIHRRLAGVVNDRLAQEALHLAQGLRAARLDLDQATGSIVSDAVRGAGEASHNMLTAALAGIKMGGKDK
ncbi:MAG: hypothetical protein WC986_14620 [Elusimicrobiota bacterium]|jgi:hypothetical protein